MYTKITDDNFGGGIPNFNLFRLHVIDKAQLCD